MASPDMQRAFVASGGEKNKRERKTTKQVAKRSPIKRVSDKQAIRNAYLQGIKDERISRTVGTFGVVQCVHCGRSFDDVERARKGLDLHHTTKRSQGQGYRDGKPGVDAPELLELVCRSCHQALGANPEWSS